MQPWFYMFDAQKNRLIETVLFSTHNVFFGLKHLKCMYIHMREVG